MQKAISLRLAFYFMLIVMVFLSNQTSAEEIIGDVDSNGVIGLEEAVYALQVVAGMKPATIINSDLEPGYSAWGIYTYLPASGGLLALNFTFSNFAKTWTFVRN